MTGTIITQRRSQLTKVTLLFNWVTISKESLSKLELLFQFLLLKKPECPYCKQLTIQLDLKHTLMTIKRLKVSFIWMMVSQMTIYMVKVFISNILSQKISLLQKNLVIQITSMPLVNTFKKLPFMEWKSLHLLSTSIIPTCQDNQQFKHTLSILLQLKNLESRILTSLSALVSKQETRLSLLKLLLDLNLLFILQKGYINIES